MKATHRFLAWMACAAYICNPAFGFEENIELEKTIEDYCINASWGSPPPISEDTRQKYIEYVRRKENEMQQAGSVSPWQFDSELIVLGDEERIRKLVKEPEDAHRYFRDLLSSGHPVAIEVMAPAIFIEEPFREGIVSDVTYMSISHKSAHNIVGVMSRCRAFNADVINWAMRLMDSPYYYKYELLRDVMRQWWTENEQFFKERNYKAVKPPPLEITDAPPNFAQPPAASEATPAPAATPSSAEPDSNTRMASWNPTPWIVSLIVLLFGAMWWWARRERGK